MSAVSRLADGTGERKSDPLARADVKSELSLSRRQFAGTPYPPTGAVAGAIALAKLVGRVEWVAGNAMLIGDRNRGTRPRVREIVGAVAESLRLSASLICDGNAHPVDDPSLVDAVQESTRRLERMIGHELDTDVSRLIDIGSDGDTPKARDRGGDDLGSGHEYRFVAGPELSGPGVWASPQRWWRTPPSRRPAPKRSGTAGWAWSLIDSRARSGIVSPPTSPSIPCGSATPCAARRGWPLRSAVAEITDVEHGFWVVLGTLSVLRSNALGTGATALRAVGGTAVGFVVGSAIMIGVGRPHRGVVGAPPRGGAGVGRRPVDDLVRRGTGRVHGGSRSFCSTSSSPSAGRSA